MIHIPKYSQQCQKNNKVSYIDTCIYCPDNDTEFKAFPTMAEQTKILTMVYSYVAQTTVHIPDTPGTGRKITKFSILTHICCPHDDADFKILPTVVETTKTPIIAHPYIAKTTIRKCYLSL